MFFVQADKYFAASKLKNVDNYEKNIIGHKH